MTSKFTGRYAAKYQVIYGIANYLRSQKGIDVPSIHREISRKVQDQIDWQLRRYIPHASLQASLLLTDKLIIPSQII